MAPTPESTDFRHVLVRRDWSIGYLFWIKWVLISFLLLIVFVFIVRTLWWFYVYDREQRAYLSWWRWNDQQAQQRWHQNQAATEDRQRRAARERDRRRQRQTQPSMRTVPVSSPQPAVLRMHIITPPPQPPPPPPPVNLMFVMVNVPDTESGGDGVPRGDTRNARTPSSPTHTNQYRREGITRADGGSERGHQRSQSRNSDRGHQRTPSRTQSRNQSRTQASSQSGDGPPPAYQP